MILIGVGCGPLPPINLAAEIKGSAVKDLDEGKKKELEDLGPKAFDELKPEDQDKAAKILNEQLQSDPKKLGKQYCHMLALGEKDKAKAEKMRTDCVKKVESGETKVNTEDMKEYFKNSGLSPAEISKAIKATGEILGSKEIVDMKLGASKEEQEKVQEKVRGLAEKSGLSADKVMGFAMGFLGSIYPTLEPKDAGGEDKGAVMAGSAPKGGSKGHGIMEVGMGAASEAKGHGVGTKKEGMGHGAGTKKEGTGHGSEPKEEGMGHGSEPKKEGKGHGAEVLSVPENEKELIKNLLASLDGQLAEIVKELKEELGFFKTKAFKMMPLAAIKSNKDAKELIDSFKKAFNTAGLSEKTQEALLDQILTKIQNAL